MTLTEPRTAQDLEVRIATTDDEREAVYRFRYDVYVQELGRSSDFWAVSGANA